MKLIFNIGFIFETAFFHKVHSNSETFKYSQKMSHVYVHNKQWERFLDSLHAFEPPQIKRL